MTRVIIESYEFLSEIVTITQLYQKLWHTNNHKRQTNTLTSLQMTNQMVGWKRNFLLVAKILKKNKKIGISPAVATLPEILKTEGLLPSIREPTNLSSLIHTKI